VTPLAQDRRARRLAQREFERPLVLEAGAGTGKTTTLVARVLAWCLGPGWEKAAAERPDAEAEALAARVLGGVVAITFTEAAAAEMAERIGEELGKLAAGKAVPVWLFLEEDLDEQRRQERALALAATLDHLVVRTIHAFCRSILAQYPLEAGLHPELQVDADGQLLETIVREVLEEHLQRAYGSTDPNPLLELAVEGFGPEELTEAALTLARELPGAEALAEDPFAPERVAAFLERVQGNLEALAEAAGPLAGVNKRNTKTLEALDALRRLLMALELPPGGGPEATERLQGLTTAIREEGEALLDKVGQWRRGKFTAGEADCLDPNSGEALRRAAGEIRPLLKHLAQLNPALLTTAREALYPLLEQVFRTLRAQGVLTFDALLQEAAALLRHNSEVRDRLRSKIDQLLVDEFQDTDRLQCRLLRRLALPDPADGQSPGIALPGLFLVGDPKQSIYGWRSADLAAYDGFLEEVCAAGGEIHPLVENFRSVPAILDEVERIVRPVMVEAHGLQPRFEPLLACEARAEDPGFARPPWQPVEYWVSQEGRSAEATRREAAALARDLLRLHRREEVPWRDVGILLRSTGDLDDYLEALRRAGIPYAVARDKQYYRRREIIEAAALVRSILDPGDPLALLTVLRSPMVAVPDAALIPLWSRKFPARMADLRGPDRKALTRIRTLVEEAAREVSGWSPQEVPGIDRVHGWELNLLAAVEALARLRRDFETEPVDRFLDHLRSLFHQEILSAARYLGVHRVANLRRFFRRLLATLEEGGDTNALLRLLRRSVAEEREGEEGRPPGAALNAVSVFTIHGAKGLDFRHVYLMQLHKASNPHETRGNQTGQIEGLLERVEYRLLGAPTLDFDRVQAQEEAVEAAERVRLLYVATTRAKDRLVLAGRWPTGATLHREREPEEATSLLDLVLPGRRPAGSLEELQEEAQDGRTTEADAGWVFLEAAEESGDEEPPVEEGPELTLPTAAQLEEEARRLRALRVEAEVRMQAPRSTAASDEAHALLERLNAGAPEDEAPSLPDRKGAERRRAMAVGSAVHRTLELFDLEVDPAAEIERHKAQLPAYLASLLPTEEVAAAVHRAEVFLNALPGSELLARLYELRDHIVARELPILLPPEDPDGAEGHIAGAIDLVYRDPETDDLVIADYKTDRVADEADLNERAAAYGEQGRIYQRALQGALGLAEAPRFELWFLGVDRIQ
jgi:ATP-dependent helicase/nuclease subunit A